MNNDEKNIVIHEVYQGYATVTYHLQQLMNELEQGKVKNLKSTIKKIRSITTRELKQLEKVVE